jgi:hypothetical protein
MPREPHALAPDNQLGEIANANQNQHPQNDSAAFRTGQHRRKRRSHPALPSVEPQPQSCPPGSSIVNGMLRNGINTTAAITIAGHAHPKTISPLSLFPTEPPCVSMRTDGITPVPDGITPVRLANPLFVKSKEYNETAK